MKIVTGMLLFFWPHPCLLQDFHFVFVEYCLPYVLLVPMFQVWTLLNFSCTAFAHSCSWGPLLWILMMSQVGLNLFTYDSKFTIRISSLQSRMFSGPFSGGLQYLWLDFHSFVVYIFVGYFYALFTLSFHCTLLPIVALINFVMQKLQNQWEYLKTRSVDSLVIQRASKWGVLNFCG